MKAIQVFALLSLIVAFGEGVSLTLVPISTFFNTPIMVQFDSITDSLVASVNYPCGFCPCPGIAASACAGVTTGSFERILPTGARVAFSNVNSFTDEVHIATVRIPNPSGFVQGDLFTGNGRNGEVVRISDSGASIISPWVVLPSNGLLRGHLRMDEIGTFGFNLIVSTTVGDVFEVFANQTFRLIVNLNEFVEGLEVVPNDSAVYGPLAGNLLTVSEVSQLMYCITPGGVVTTFATKGCSGDNVNLVHDGDNFFGVNFGTNNILGAKNAEVQALAGDLVITCEGFNTAVTGKSGMLQVFWDGTNVQFVPITLTSSSFIPAQWEHVEFVNAGLVEILPSDFNFCYFVDKFGVNTRFGSVITPQIAPVEYSYNIAYPGQSSFSPDSYNGQVVTALADTLQIYFYQDNLNNFYLTMLIDKVNSGTGGALDLALSLSGVSFVGTSTVVQDDPILLTGSLIDFGDSFTWSTTTGTGRFTWRWGPTTTDGVMLGPLPAVGNLAGNFCFQVQILAVTNVTSLVFNNQTSVSPSINPNTLPTFQICRISCTCGNGVVDIGAGEQCDLGAQNGAPGTCCSDTCTFLQGTICASNSSNVCAGVATCTGTSAVCPPIPVATLCNCTAPNFGPNCVFVDCGQATTCGQCQAVSPKCGWCCDPQNPNQGTCLQQNLNPGACPRFQPPGGCSCVGTCQNGGTCNCGTCDCISPFTGSTCQSELNCFGQTVPVGTPLPAVDVCGVCGGNGTSCIGCNGVPNGPKLDQCGVCGGTGNECIQKCPYTSCIDCQNAEGCGFCPATKTCIETQNEKSQCPKGLVSNCSALSTTALVATTLSAGIIAAIVIAAVVAAVLAAIGSKKGYDYWKKKQGTLGNVQSNPMFVSPGTDGNNPLYSQELH